ncbi:hypothetical protein GCM10011376_01610 [Nocardioides flavus (ex Wang et al. 2016)]|uniref:WXG100 family type VII secretion target n=1 Tax=Nocardioides flavus (ex Wang et al. 2016) TaxID=2058780 RepID=A0ABQ3HDA0_9ACTN|nr:hypothetical protein [Nocardioides flavus (ex Wang et al. 2016)]GHE15080.1 hypothetical protein GCM10011376_01610 [Nocardioides flavus (ex Wang et al. 2016)]
MNAVMTVDLSELDAWAAQVQRASDDLSGIARNGGHGLVQTDFGPILETMMGAYHSLLPTVHQSLEDNGTGLRDHAEALRATARDFTLTEDGIVRRHQATGVDARDGSTGFWDVADTTIRRATPTETNLPQVSLGFPYDTVCDLVRMLTGFDIRAELAERIGGDVVTASTQGSCFGALGTSMKGVAANLQGGSQTITRTWQGSTADAAIGQIGTWVGSLDRQAGQLVQMGRNIVQICRDAWQTALSVVQCVKAAVQTVSAALATMSIPGVGWARVVQAVYQAFQAVMKAYKALMKLIDILQQVRSFIETVKNFFDGDKPPVSTPTAPVSTGTPSSVTRDPSTITSPTVGQRPAPVAPVAPSPA